MICEFVIDPGTVHVLLGLKVSVKGVTGCQKISDSDSESDSDSA